jgi:predicted nucleotidyltransferase
MDKAEVVKKLKLYKELLHKEIDFEEIILFGSYASGTNHEDSDIDVDIVVNEDKGDFFTTRPLLWKVRRAVDDRIEPTLFERSHDESGFLAKIKKTGLII